MSEAQERFKAIYMRLIFVETCAINAQNAFVDEMIEMVWAIKPLRSTLF